MMKRLKTYLKLNLMSIFFIIVSFISVTLAWFAYSGLSNVDTEIGVKAWYIELEQNGEQVSNDLIIPVLDIYPGMDTIYEKVNINNLGDSDARIKYKIVSARILDDESDNYVVNDQVTSEYVEDLLSHAYPFHININLTKNYALAQVGESSFEVSISWPLDSGNDELDGIWGANAYQFRQSEELTKSNAPEYEIRPSMQLVISVTAEQYIEEDTESDLNYNLGDTVLFDVVSNSACLEISSTCLNTYIIDTNNTIGDGTVTLLPDVSNSYTSNTYSNYDTSLSSLTSSWTATTRALVIGDILGIISKDIMNSLLIRDGISNSIIGNLSYGNRLTTEVSTTISSGGYYTFLNEKFNYLISNNCYWIKTEYDTTNSFVVEKIDTINSKIYGKSKDSTCQVIPVIVANKSNL